MTISSELVRVQVLGDGARTVFDYNFIIPAQTYARLFLTTGAGITSEIAAANWTLGSPNNPAGGTFTYPKPGSGGVPAPVGSVLTLVRDNPYAQLTNLRNQGAYYPAVVEGALDWQTMLSQQLAAQMDRALRGSLTGDVIAELPSKAARVNGALWFDANGDPVITAASVPSTPASAFGATLIQAASAAAARLLLGFSTFGATLIQAASAAAARLLLGFSTFGGTLGAAADAAAARTLLGTDVRETWVNVLAYGADRTGATNAAPAIQAAVNAAAGRTVYLPAGIYRIDSTISYNGQMNIVGDGNGAGPGSASQASSGCTAIYCNFANPTAFAAVTRYPCTFRNFQINVNPGFRPAAGGAGIDVRGEVAGGTNANTRIENVSFNWLNVGIYAFKPNWWTIRDCYFGDWSTDAILSETNSATEGSLGYVTNNYFFGETAGVQRSCIFLRNGYCIISENEILGAQYGVRVENRDYPSGFIRVINNTIEEQYYGGVYITTTDTNDVSMIDLTGNEFSAIITTATYQGSIQIADGPARTWLQDVTIKNNTSRHLGTCALGFIRVGAGQNVQVFGNVNEYLGGGSATSGIGIVGTAVNTALGGVLQVFDNIFKGTFTKRYDFGSGIGGVALRDHEPMTFAAIPVNTRNGSMIYCSDGRGVNVVGLNYTLTNGGTGAMAAHQRGQWLVMGPLS